MLKRSFSIKPVDGVSDLLENFPSFASHVWSDSGNASHITSSELSLQAENQHLRVVLEKERYRRKVRILLLSPLKTLECYLIEHEQSVNTL